MARLDHENAASGQSGLGGFSGFDGPLPECFTDALGRTPGELNDISQQEFFAAARACGSVGQHEGGGFSGDADPFDHDREN